MSTKFYSFCSPSWKGVQYIKTHTALNSNIKTVVGFFVVISLLVLTLKGTDIVYTLVYTRQVVLRKLIIFKNFTYCCSGLHMFLNEF